MSWNLQDTRFVSHTLYPQLLEKTRAKLWIAPIIPMRKGNSSPRGITMQPLQGSWLESLPATYAYDIYLKKISEQ